MALGGEWLPMALWTAAVIAAVFFAILAYINRVAWSFRLTNAWYGMPVVGKLSRLARGHVNREEDGWLTAEKTLCQDYMPFIDFRNEDDFARCRTYLKRAQDHGRTPLHPMGLFLLLLLVAAEAFGFSYMLAGVIGTDISEIGRLYGTGAIILVVCLLMFGLTHWAGHEMYKNRLIDRCRAEWQNFNQLLENNATKQPLYTGDIGLDDDQDKGGDDRRPWFTQCMNRVHRDRGWIIITLAIVAVISLAVLQTGMRYFEFNRTEIAATSQPAVPDFAAMPLPNDMVQPQAEADGKAARELSSARRGESLWGFIMLGAIYLFTQFLSMYSGFKYGFGGREGRAAYDLTRGAGDYAEYMRLTHRRIAMANGKLLALHEKLQKKGVVIPLEFTHTFDDYIKVDRAQAWSRGRKDNFQDRVDAVVAQMEGKSAEERKAILNEVSDARVFDAVVEVLNERKAAAPGLSEAEQARRAKIIEDL